MNDNLKNYTEQPDAEVWQKINGKMRKDRILRQAVGAVAGAALVAVAAVALLRPADQTEQVVVAAEEPVAMVQTEVATVAECASDAMTAEPVVRQQQQVQPEVQKGVETSASPVSPVVEAPVKAVAAESPVAAPVVRQSAAANNVAPVAKPAPVRPAADLSENSQPVSNPQKVTSGQPAQGSVKDTILWIPNVFAPGSDDPEINQFRARLSTSSESVSNFKMTIFNRSGHQVFHSSDINTPWDGTYKGQQLPQASYVYIIYYTDKDKIQHQRKGTITLVR